MTQVLALASPDYVILAADRRLTSVATGAVVADDRAKIVSLCNQTAFGFTGPAELEGEPTHLWIARRLADGRCRGMEGPDLWPAYRELGTALNRLFATRNPAPALEILSAGYSIYPNPYGRHRPYLAPYLASVSNVTVNEAGLRTAGPGFHWWMRPMFARREPGGHPWGLAMAGADFGATLDNEQSRAERLDLACRSLIRRVEGPRAALRLLVKEIQHTAEHGARRNGVVPVNSSVLAVCIPVGSIMMALRTGRPRGLTHLDLDATWPYFADYDPQLDEFHQRGPLVVNGTAIIDVNFGRNAEGGFRAWMRFIRAPSEPGDIASVVLPDATDEEIARSDGRGGTLPLPKHKRGVQVFRY